MGGVGWPRRRQQGQRLRLKPRWVETQAEMNDFPWNVLLGLGACRCSDMVNENETSEQGPMPKAGLPPAGLSKLPQSQHGYRDHS